MSDSKHTPGPWEMDTQRTDTGAIWVMAGGRDIALLMVRDPETRETLPALANGRLMTAAPKLLAACRSAVRLLETVGCFAGTDPDAVHQLNEAIAYATLPGADCDEERIG